MDEKLLGSNVAANFSLVLTFHDQCYQCVAHGMVMRQFERLESRLLKPQDIGEKDHGQGPVAFHESHGRFVVQSQGVQRTFGLGQRLAQFSHMHFLVFFENDLKNIRLVFIVAVQGGGRDAHGFGHPADRDGPQTVLDHEGERRLGDLFPAQRRFHSFGHAC